MYEKFFSLTTMPFDGLPDRKFFYVGNSQHQALDVLTENLSRQGCICVLSGPSGSGKTTLVRMLIRSLPVKMRIIAIDDPRLDEHMLLATILRASGIMATSLESIPDLTLKVRKMLQYSMQFGVVTTVILDEAQGLSDQVIEQIRLISNIEGDLGKMINFLLVGQDELIHTIKKPEHKMFMGRVKAFARIPKLKRDEVQAYVTFRLQQAGCHEPLFSNRAFSALYQATDGLPRLINSVADRCLQIACQSNKHLVSRRIVKKAEQVVRHPRDTLKHSLKERLKSALGFITCKLPLFLLGVAASAGVFALCYFLLPHELDSHSIRALVLHDETVNAAYENLRDGMLRGQLRKNRERALFDIGISKSVFRGDAIDTLIKVWGYRRRDNNRIACEDLAAVSLGCSIRQGSIKEAEAAGRPAVLSLRDDNMTPFYAVLLHLDAEKAEVIFDRKLWMVKRAWLEHVYDGEYTAVFNELPESLEKAEGEELAKITAALEKYFAADEKYSSLKNRKATEAAFEEFLIRTDSEPDPELLYDRLCAGPSLEFKDKE